MMSWQTVPCREPLPESPANPCRKRMFLMMILCELLKETVLLSMVMFAVVPSIVTLLAMPISDLRIMVPETLNVTLLPLTVTPLRNEPAPESLRLVTLYAVEPPVAPAPKPEPKPKACWHVTSAVMPAQAMMRNVLVFILLP